MTSGGSLLLGRRTYLDAGFWPYANGASAELRLVEAVPTTTGVLITRYQPTTAS